MEQIKNYFENILSEGFNKKVKILSLKNLSGGCINNALKVVTNFGDFFIKYKSDINLEMYEAEAEGLKILSNSEVLNIPKVILIGKREGIIYLILEYIESGSPAKNFCKEFGAALASLHGNSNGNYGLDFNNYIGSLPQINIPSESWVNFFIENRLNVQLKLARENSRIDKSIVLMMETLFKKIPEILIDDKPALLHGDLWSGNFIINSSGRATLIDPAVYYGNREIEIAFTTLFGGFNEDFYDGYKNIFPLANGYEERFDIYNLYPLLVHVNLFGGGYLNSVKGILKKYS